MISLASRVRKIYIDANVIIYLVEGSIHFQEKAQKLFEYVDANGIAIATSELSAAECLYGTHRLGRADLSEKYRWLFQDSGVFELVAVDLSLCWSAARIGADNRLKLIDALHLASALRSGCDTFVTNDRGIRSYDTVQVVQLSQV